MNALSAAAVVSIDSCKRVVFDLDALRWARDAALASSTNSLDGYRNLAGMALGHGRDEERSALHQLLDSMTADDDFIELEPAIQIRMMAAATETLAACGFVLAPADAKRISRMNTKTSY